MVIESRSGVSKIRSKSKQSVLRLGWWVNPGERACAVQVQFRQALCSGGLVHQRASEEDALGDL